MHMHKNAIVVHNFTFVQFRYILLIPPLSADFEHEHGCCHRCIQRFSLSLHRYENKMIRAGV